MYYQEEIELVSAKEFWSDYLVSKYQEVQDVDEVVESLFSYILDYNTKTQDNLKIKENNLKDVLREILSKGDSDQISQKDIMAFFENIWEKDENRLSINQVSLDVEHENQNDLDYLMIYQFLIELDEEEVMHHFKSLKFNSQMLMSCDLGTLMILFKDQINPKTLCMIHLKKEQLKQQMQFYQEIEHRAQEVEKAARKVADEVNQAKLAGKLQKVVVEGKTYHIEDAENGNGLCEMISGTQRFLSRRTGFRTYRDHCAIVDQKNIVYCLLNKTQQFNQGYLVNHFLNSEICYCSMSFRNYQNVNNQAKQFQISVELSDKYKKYGIKENFDGLLKLNGEFIIQTNTQQIYKEYYLKGKKVNWNKFKQKGLIYKLDIDNLMNLKKVLSLE